MVASCPCPTSARVEDASRVTLHAGVFLHQRIDFLVPPRSHVRFVRVWAARDDLSDAVLSGGVCPSRVLATMSLNMATLEHQSVDQIEIHAFRPGWDTDMAQWLVMWATAFLPHLTDPLGVAESFAQDRAVHDNERKLTITC